ncbi:F0F1 ATP synthase subunit A [Candidatus Woesebacteria bacterium]|nr:F0F1 ATP synthase subunit A [Candidatus Woesebacteria bacterium]
MAATALHISLSAEPIFQFGGITFTNSMFTSVVVSGLLILFAVLVNTQLKQTNKPQGIQNFAEWMIEALYNLVHSITGDLKRTNLFFPFIATFFLFILINNWFGLLPGVGTIVKKHDQTTTITEKQAAKAEDTHTAPVEELKIETTVKLDEHGQVITEHSKTLEEPIVHEATPEHKPATPIFRPGTADLNMTIALGTITILLVQFFGVKFLHLSYFTKFFNFSSPIMFFVGILELISEVGKILSFGFRLFGNVFAGEVLLVVIMSLAGIVVPMPFYALEIFVGFIQALVFAMLSLVFFNMATLGHGEHD